MNYSDYDSEDYSSNEDEDYVPSGEMLFVLLAVGVFSLERISS